MVPLPANRYQAALLRHFHQQPDALFCRQVGDGGETRITWRDLEADCGRFAAAYEGAGAGAGAQVLIFLRHVPELYGAFFGAILAGVIPAFMPCTSPRQDPDLYWRSHQALLARIRPAALVTDAATMAEMRDAGLVLGCPLILIEDLPPARPAFRPVPEAQIALLQHSSGTTGLKKGVALSYEAILAQIDSYAASLAIDGRDVIVSWLPLYHDMGLIACLVTPAFLGVPVTHIDPFHWLAHPASLFEALAADRGTLTWLPNFAFEHLSATAGRRSGSWDLSGVRAFINCSEPCKAATFDRFAAAFAASGVRPAQLQCCYAMAETVFAVTQTALGAPPRRRRFDPATLGPGATPTLADGGAELLETGAPIAGLRVSLRDQAGAPLPDGVVGEIAIAGVCLFSGYNKDPVRTAERLRDGLYFSHDLGFLHEDRLYVLGRQDDLIIVNGRNLYAHEVEAAVNAVAGVKPGRAVALAWFDERVGSESLVIMAERAAASGRSDAEVRREVMGVVRSVFDVAPRAVELLDEGRLIKTTSGKISRTENLARWAAGQEASHVGPSLGVGR